MSDPHDGTVLTLSQDEGSLLSALDEITPHEVLSPTLQALRNGLSEWLG